MRVAPDPVEDVEDDAPDAVDLPDGPVDAPDRSRIPLLLLAAVAAIVVGAAGLVRGFVPAATAPAAPEIPASAVRAGDVAVYGAWVREPATADTAAAYLTITNTGSAGDVLESVSSGASAQASLHDIGKPAAKPSNAGEAQQEGPGTMTEDDSATIRAGATVRLTPGDGHIMLEGLIGPLLPGQSVNLLLQFRRAGTVIVEAPVVAIGGQPPAA